MLLYRGPKPNPWLIESARTMYKYENIRHFWLLAAESPDVRSYAVCIYGSGQPYLTPMTSSDPLPPFLSCRPLSSSRCQNFCHCPGSSCLCSASHCWAYYLPSGQPSLSRPWRPAPHPHHCQNCACVWSCVVCLYTHVRGEGVRYDWVGRGGDSGSECKNE